MSTQNGGPKEDPPDRTSPLLFGFAAFAADAVENHRMLSQRKVVLIGDLFLKFLKAFVVKFDHFAALLADHMIVMPLHQIELVIFRIAASELDRGDDADLFEQGQHPVHGRDADADSILTLQQLHNLLGIEMLVTLENSKIDTKPAPFAHSFSIRSFEELL